MSKMALYLFSPNAPHSKRSRPSSGTWRIQGRKYQQRGRWHRIAAHRAQIADLRRGDEQGCRRQAGEFGDDVGMFLQIHERGGALPMTKPSLPSALMPLRPGMVLRFTTRALGGQGNLSWW